MLMTMSHIPASVRQQLQDLAFEVREVFGERGHLIDVALSADPSFNEAGNRSALVRSMVKSAVRTGASRWGVDFEDTMGALDIRFDLGSQVLVFRVKKAKRRADGTLQIITNTASSWGLMDEESLIPEEQWVFAFVANDSTIEELSVAPVLGVTEKIPGYLILGNETLLNDGEGTPRGFSGDNDEFLPGFEDDEDEGEAGNFGVSS